MRYAELELLFFYYVLLISFKFDNLNTIVFLLFIFNRRLVKIIKFYFLPSYYQESNRISFITQL